VAKWLAILWSRGLHGATVQLENLWNKFIHSNEFCLFCAYPRSGFTEEPHVSMTQICNTHSKIVNATNDTSNTIVYTTTQARIAG
jgi:hypothetical protein